MGGAAAMAPAAAAGSSGRVAFLLLDLARVRVEVIEEPKEGREVGVGGVEVAGEGEDHFGGWRGWNCCCGLVVWGGGSLEMGGC